MEEKDGKWYTELMNISPIGNGNITAADGNSRSIPLGAMKKPLLRKNGNMENADNAQFHQIETLAELYGPNGAARFLAIPESTFTYLMTSKALAPEELVRVSSLYQHWKTRRSVSGVEPIQPVEPVHKISDRDPEPEFTESTDDEANSLE